MADEREVEWQVPDHSRGGTYIAGWCSELVQSGERWLKGQRSIENVDDDVKVLMGLDQPNVVKSNELQTDIRTFVETISDLRQIGTYGSKAPQFEKNVRTYNDVTKHIFVDSKFVFQMRKTLQYSMLGRGYIWPKFTREDFGWGKGRMHFDALGPLQYLPEQLPLNNCIQDAYAGTAIIPMGIAEAHARFPKFQDKIQSIARYDWKSYGTLSMVDRLDFYNRSKFSDQPDWDYKHTEFRYHWIRDLSINRSGRAIQMGQPGASWAYVVPAVGDLLVFNNPFNNLPESRKAKEEDCRIYPQLRLIITNPTVTETIYDGTAFDWHGRIPPIAVDVNDWAWSPIGYSLIRQVASLERARRRLVSGMSEVTQVRLDPPLGFDLQSGVSRAQLEKLNLLTASGFRIGTNGAPERALKSILPDSMQVTEQDYKHVELLDSRVKGTLGLMDITSLQELKAGIAESSFDKVLENLGPISKGIAANIAAANGEVCEQLKYSIPQYYTISELMSYIGPDGVSMQTFDFDPQSLVPSHMPGEDQKRPSAYSKRQRARWFCDRLAITSTASQLLNVTQQQERLMYMLFLQRGVPGISYSTIMEKLGVKDYGQVDGDTEWERWRNEQIRNETLQIQMQILGAQMMQDAGIQPPGAPPGPGQGKGGGRPNTDSADPKLEQRGSTTNNPRAIIATSK